MACNGQILPMGVIVAEFKTKGKECRSDLGIHLWGEMLHKNIADPLPGLIQDIHVAFSGKKYGI